MVKKKIKNFKELWVKKFKESNKEYLEMVKQHGGQNLYFRALTAQILWLLLFYVIYLKLVPIKNFITANVLILAILGLVSRLWGVIKDKLPTWAPDMIKGAFFFDLEIKFLNRWLWFLFLMNIILIFLPVGICKKVYQKMRG